MASEQPPTTQVICVHDARDACKGEVDLVERLRKAMRATHDHWIESDEQKQFNAALAATLMETFIPEQRQRLIDSVNALRSLALVLEAAKLGIPLDLDKMENPRDDVIPLNRLWIETRIPRRSLNSENPC